MAKKGAGGEESVVVPAQMEESVVKQSAPRKRNPCPGIRAVGGRIYDPENGKTCHQCRQKTMDFAVACKQPGKKGLCPIHFCHKCLLNRYGENAEEMTKKEGWTCPKCRGICNCSFCRKRRGETPTGILAHAAKASGHSSVHELLAKGSDMVAAAQTLTSLPAKIKKERKEGNKKRALGADDAVDGLSLEGDENIVTDFNVLPSDPAKKKLTSLPVKIKKERKEGKKKRALETDATADGSLAEGNENIVIDPNALPSVPINKKPKKGNKKKALGTEAAADGSLAEGNGNIVIDPNALPSVPINKKPKKGNKKRAPGTDAAADGSLAEGNENIVTDPNALPSVPIIKKPKKGNKKRALGTDAAADGLLAEGDGNIVIDLNSLPSVPITKKLKKGNHNVNNVTADEKLPVENKGEPHIKDESTVVLKTKIELPSGTPVTNIVGAELEVNDVGSAIQFYEFCRTFGEVFQIRKGQPEKILQVIAGGGRIGREVPSVIADLHIRLLSVIQEDREEKPLDYSRDANTWIIETGKCISESRGILKELPLDCLNQGVLGYKNLSPSLKLHVLNFLCDETLSTTTLKDWVVKQNESATERKIAAREKVRAAKEKETELKERLKDQMARSMFIQKKMFLRKGAEINRLISQIKEAKEHTKAAVDGLCEENLGGLLRTKPVKIDKGVAYWKFDSYYNRRAIMRQELDTTRDNDMWFTFTEEEEKIIGDHVAPRSQVRCKNHTRLELPTVSAA